MSPIAQSIDWRPVGGSRLVIAVQTGNDGFGYSFGLSRVSNGNRHNPGLFCGIVVPSHKQGIADVNRLFQ